MNKKILKNFRLPEETIQKLEHLSDLTGEDMTTIIVHAINEHRDAIAAKIADDLEGRANRIRRSFNSKKTVDQIEREVVESEIEKIRPRGRSSSK